MYVGANEVKDLVSNPTEYFKQKRWQIKKILRNASADSDRLNLHFNSQSTN